MPKSTASKSPKLTVAAVVLALLLAMLPHGKMLVLGFMPMLQALIPVLCLIAFGLVITLVLFRKFLPALVLLLGALCGGFPLLVPTTGTADPSATDLTILSANVEHAGADSVALAALIEEHQVDVAILVETDDAMIEGLLSQDLEQVLPYRSETVSPGGLAGSVILSKFPLQDEEHIPVPYGITSFDLPVAVIGHPQFGAIRVAGVHPYPPLGGAVAWQQTLESITAWRSENTNLPLIIAGDFNASHAHPVFRDLVGSLTDTAGAAGFLPIPTWPATGLVPAFTAIDHILVHDLVATQWERVKIPNTDHYGIIARVAQPAK